MSTTTINRPEVAAHPSWDSRRIAPVYLRGIPSWVWESAMVRSRHHPQPVN